VYHIILKVHFAFSLRVKQATTIGLLDFIDEGAGILLNAGKYPLTHYNILEYLNIHDYQCENLKITNVYVLRNYLLRTAVYLFVFT